MNDPEYLFNFEELTYRHVMWEDGKWCMLMVRREPGGSWVYTYNNEVVKATAFQVDAEHAYKDYIANLILGPARESLKKI